MFRVGVGGYPEMSIELLTGNLARLTPAGVGQAGQGPRGGVAGGHAEAGQHAGQLEMWR